GAARAARAAHAEDTEAQGSSRDGAGRGAEGGRRGRRDDGPRRGPLRRAPPARCARPGRGRRRQARRHDEEGDPARRPADDGRRQRQEQRRGAGEDPGRRGVQAAGDVQGGHPRRDEEGTGASGVSGTGEAVLRGTGEVSSKENGRRKTGNRKPETVRSRIRTFPVSRCLFPVACFFFSVPAIARTGFGDYVKAVRALEEQRIDDARDLVAALAKAAPDDPEVQALEAQVAFLDGDYARAAGLLDKLTDPKLKELKPLVNETIAATKGMLHKDSPHFSIFYQPG